MLKRKLQKLVPSKEQLQNNKSLSIFGSILYNSNLWYFNRVSVSRAFAVGLFFAWVPVPFQMLLAAAGAIIFYANLPISIGLVWLTNPVTMPPLFYIAYKIGARVMGIAPSKFNFQPTMEWLMHLFSEKWQPFILGCAIMAIFSSLAGYIIVRLVWRYMTIRSWQDRKEKRKARKELKRRQKHQKS